MYNRTKASLFLLLLCLPVMLFAQEDSDPSVEPDWDIYNIDTYSAGDKTFNISIGTVFPVVFVREREIIEHNFSPPVGGASSLSYNFFLNSRIFVGGEVSGMFIPTLSKNTTYIIPLGVKAGYQLYLWRFEFPLSISLGMCWHRYLDLGYFGFFMKGGGAIYYRFNSDWSFGLNANWCFLPEWTKDKKNKDIRTREKDVYGNIVELTLSARYHF
jgi:hypothetical protein